MAFEEIGEMGHFLKAEAGRDFRDGPVGLLEQQFGFLNYPAANQVGGGAAGMFFEHHIDVVHVHRQPVGVILSRPRPRR